MQVQTVATQATLVPNVMRPHSSERVRSEAIFSCDHWLNLVTFTPRYDWYSIGNFHISIVCTDRPVVRPIISDDALFQHLTERWHLERGATSSVTKMATCRSYQRIIGMGRQVAVPLILNDLAARPENPDHWFWALQALTGEDPVPEDARGDMRRMAQAWLQWGRSNGYA